MGSAAPVPPGLARLNGLPTVEATAQLRTCLDVPRWARELSGRRPFPDTASLQAAGSDLAGSLDEAEIEQALAAHPRIGDRPSATGIAASWSRQEQAGVDRGDADLAAALAAGNRAYEERFGRVFLICASGLSGRQLLDALQRRLGNDAATEQAVVAEELRKIALLRLERLAVAAR